jgi:hypothetical protein
MSHTHGDNVRCVSSYSTWGARVTQQKQGMIRRGLAARSASTVDVLEPEEEALSEIQIKVRLSLASSLGRLDLSDARLKELPSELWELDGLEELSLAGNRLEELSAGG